MIALILGGGVSGVGKSLNLDECFGAAFFCLVERVRRLMRVQVFCFITPQKMC